MERIEIKKKREFGDIVGDAVKLYIRNFKKIIPAVLKVGLTPYIIAAAIGLVFAPYVSDIVTSSTDGGIFGELMGIGAVSGSFTFTLAIGILISQIFIYAFMFKWIEDYASDKQIETDELGLDYQQNIKIVFNTSLKLFGLVILLMIPFGILIGILSIIPLLGILAIPLIFVLMYYGLMLSFLYYIRIHEKTSFTQGLTRCKEVIKDHWWQTFGLLFVTSIMSSILSMVFVLPFGLLSGFSTILGLESMETTFILVQSIVSNLASLLIMPFSIFVIVLQYHNLTEFSDGTSLNKIVDSFDEKEDEFFENEGDF